MAATLYSAAVAGLDAELVTIETRIAPGLGYLIVGLPDDAVKESLFRVESALSSAGFHMPRQRILISMAPAGLRKSGAVYDLPIALSILCESGQLDEKAVEGWLSAGELSLNGKLRPVRGAITMALEAKTHHLKGVLLPSANVLEAQMVDGIAIHAFENLAQVIVFLHAPQQTVASPAQSNLPVAGGNATDFSEIRGQQQAKYALEIAAAGGHHVLLNGPPGAGKSMLAQRLPTILPPPALHERLDIARIYSIAGLLGQDVNMAGRPFRSPHHTSSDIALVGGGLNPLPGEITLAHHGVLFLDELPEFRRRVLEVLRQPLEERRVTVSRANYNVLFPADFLLVAAMNPCPCGYQGHPRQKCRCTLRGIQNYTARISGPILDRIDIQLPVAPVSLREMEQESPGESSPVILERVIAARVVQQARQGDTLNAHLTGDQLRQHCFLAPREKQLFFDALEKHHCSARAYHRILKVARTIADLAGSQAIDLIHLSEAIGFRSGIQI